MLGRLDQLSLCFGEHESNPMNKNINYDMHRVFRACYESTSTTIMVYENYKIPKKYVPILNKIKELTYASSLLMSKLSFEKDLIIEDVFNLLIQVKDSLINLMDYISSKGKIQLTTEHKNIYENLINLCL